MKRYLYATRRSPVLRATIRLRDLWRVEIERENTQYIRTLANFVVPDIKYQSEIIMTFGGASKSAILK